MRALFVAGCVGLASCTAAPPATVATTQDSASAVELSEPAALQSITTANSPDGNRLVSGHGNMPADPITADLGEPARWVLAVPDGDTALWVVVAESGAVSAFSVSQGRLDPRPVNLQALPPGTPPSAAVGPEGVLLLAPPPPTASLFTNPIALSDGGLAFVAADGSVVTVAREGNRTFDIDALPDARLVSDGGLIAVLTAPTDRYAHGVLGDTLEAGAVTVVDPSSQTVVQTIEFDSSVVEGVAPMWADVDGDGVSELLVTLSDSGGGARLAVISESGQISAESDPIGVANRWRHQIAVGPLGPGGETEIVEVITPHLGGIVTFRRMDGPHIPEVASLSGFTSHVLGSRNLDMAVVADADGDGQPEVVLPTQDRNELAGLERSAEGVEVAWSVPLDAPIVSNLAAADVGGRLVVGLGTADGRLLVWE